MDHHILVFVILASHLALSEGKVARCYACRSRGSQGDCHDLSTFNGTDNFAGVTTPSCISQWCSKFIEGISGPPDAFGTAVERDCLLIPPTDGEERCAKTTIKGKQTLICFCKGDLCNSAPSILFSFSYLVSIVSIIATVQSIRYHA